MPEPTIALSVARQAAAELTKEASSLIGRLFGPAADEIGEHLRLRLHGYFERNRNATLNRAAEMIGAAGGSAHEVPLRTMVPLLEGASLEDDADLRERWAALLANAALATSADAIPPLFASILKNITPTTARCLDLLGKTTKPRRGGSSMGGIDEAGGTTLPLLTDELHGGRTSDLSERRQHVALTSAAVDVLVREGLASVTPRLRYDSRSDLAGSHSVGGRRPPVEQAGLDIRVTDLGVQFLRACTAPAITP
jgi:hypothetical protein